MSILISTIYRVIMEWFPILATLKIVYLVYYNFFKQSTLEAKIKKWFRHQWRHQKDKLKRYCPKLHKEMNKR